MSDEVMSEESILSPETVDEIAAVLRGHRARSIWSPDCACGWRPGMYLDVESDAEGHRYHQAQVIAEMLSGWTGDQWPPMGINP